MLTNITTQLLLNLILFFIILIVLPIFYLKFFRKKTNQEIINELIPKQKKISIELIGSIKLFLILFLFNIIFSLIFSYLSIQFGLPIGDSEKVSQEIIPLITGNTFLFLLVIIFMALFEEIFFRAFLLKRFKNIFNFIFEKLKITNKSNKISLVKIITFLSIIFSSVIFSLGHIDYNSNAELLAAFLLGIILAYWFNKNNSIYQNYLGHLFFNLFVIFLLIISM